MLNKSGSKSRFTYPGRASDAYRSSVTSVRPKLGNQFMCSISLVGIFTEGNSTPYRPPISFDNAISKLCYVTSLDSHNYRLK